MLGSSQLDLVIGLDIHMEMVPTPAPVPTPFPMPFVGMVEFTPFGTLIALGIAKAVSCVTGEPPSGPVLINGFPATKTGDEASNKKMLPHMVIPPGTMWTPLPKPLKVKMKPGPPPPPDNPAAPPGDAVLVTGSKTVYSEGSNQCRLGDLAMSCSDPVRLPSSVLLAIPKGMPVLVGGPPAFDWTTTAKAFFLRNKWTAGLLHSLVSRLPPGRLRNLLGKAACFLTGHPVDVATGRLLTDATDFELRGPIPLTFERNYASSWAHRDSTLGYGWSHSFDERIWVERGKVVYKARDGREIEFQCYDLPGRYMREGQERFYPIDRLTLKCHGNGYWSIRTPDGLVREFEPVAGLDSRVSMLRRIKDRVGHGVNFDYAGGFLDTVSTSEGRWMRFVHQHGLLQRVVVQNGEGVEDGWYNQVRFTYSPERDLIAATDPSNRSRTYKYDAHLLIEERDRDGITFWFEYDGRDQSAYCVRTWGTDWKTTDRLFFREITYDKKNGRTFVEDSLGHTTTYVMNPANAVVEVIDPQGATTKYEYNEFLWETAEIDALGQTTRTEYDARGNETKRVLPNGAAVTVEYNGFDQPVRMIDALGVEWGWSYDRLGRPSSQWNSAGEHVELEYEGRVLKSMVHAGERRHAFEYDGAENVSRVTLPDGTAQERWYDRQGRIIKLRDATGRAIRFVYDWESHVSSMEETGGITRRMAYSGEGDVIGYQDNLRHIFFDYAGYHSLAWRMEGGEKIAYRYDSEGELEAIINELGEAYSFMNDACGRTSEERGFEGRKHLFVRDPLGRVTTWTRPDKNEVKVAYDAMGNIVSMKYPDGTEAAFTYDAIGNMLSATNASGTVRWERDRLGRVVRESFNEDWVTSAYNVFGERVQVGSSRGLRQEIVRSPMGDVQRLGLLERDAHGIVRMSGWLMAFERDALGRETKREMPGNVAVRQSYDERGLPQTRDLVRSAEVLARTQYTWVGDDRLRRRADQGLGATDYVHDARGRLDSARFPDGSIQLRAPGPTGNLSRKRDRSDRRYLSSGILREADGTTFLYNYNGSLIHKRTRDGNEWEYTWNGAEMLAGVRGPDGVEVEFAYDALGRRVTKVVRRKGRDEVVREWRWDGNVPVHEWTNGADGVKDMTSWLFEPEGFTPLGKIERERGKAARSYAIVSDYLGTPQEMLDENGHVIWRAQLDLYGTAHVTEGSSEACPWRWPGQYEDRETGLYYNRFRYYDPSRGDYISQDPIRFRGSGVLYGYVDDPCIWIDPLGLRGRGRGSGCATGGDGDEEGLKQSLRAKLRQIEGEAALPGDRGIRAAVERREVDKLARAFLGPGHSILERGKKGEFWLISADGKRLVRSTTEKRGSAFARTGKQANFHQRQTVRDGWFDKEKVSNVHVHVK
ncbi:DUF6531 domain-containing protein [Pendulispora albinea]|uniref:DUF6531 domain-containing protein n=1 Tax=Pendulispora albinea TaxID=2741071 RepID=A0ABZ2MAN0_9BACT